MPSNKTRAEIKTLVEVAQGGQPADLVIADAKLVNVYSGEILEHQSVAVKDRWIAFVGPDATRMIGPDTVTIEAGGQTLIPGLIDGHTHIAWLYSAPEFVRFVAPGGTTLAVTEALEPYFVTGCDGAMDFLDSLKDQPIKILATAPGAASISKTARGISSQDLERLLERDDIIGLGETYWQEVLKYPDIYLDAMAKTLDAGKLLEGHTAGARDAKLNAYVATGVSSCHEPINAEQVLSGVRLGLHIMIREGSIRSDLSEIAQVKDMGIDLRRLVLVTDSVSAEDLIARGYMDHLVQKAIDSGFDPVSAIQMATLNPAEHLGLDHLTGGIGPGKLADMVLVPDPRTIEARLVISDGRIIARDGRLTVPVREHQFKEASLRSVNIPEPLAKDDFVIEVGGNEPTVNVRAIEMVTDLVTRETCLDLPCAKGRLVTETERDIVKVAAIDRTHQPGRRFVGIMRGFGLKRGAFACSAAWDTSDIVVVGCSDDDMAFAVNRIRELQGGAVICLDGDITAEMPLPVFGILTTEPMETVAEQSRQLSRAARAQGVTFPNPLLSLITLTGAAIPYLRICEEGLVNLIDGKVTGLVTGH
jgi:adenine deaminase